MDQNPVNPRPRGGQPGNTNARRHGFYASSFLKKDRTDLSGHEFTGLQEEINLLRVTIRRTCEELSAAGFASSPELLRTLCHALFCLSRLLRTHYLITNAAEAETVQAILSTVVREMDAESPPPFEPTYTSIVAR